MNLNPKFRSIRLWGVRLTLLSLVLGFFGLIGSQAKATPYFINTYNDCPPRSDTIQVWLDGGNSPTGFPIVRTIPFDLDTILYYEQDINQWVEYDNYLRGVLGGEVGIENFFDENVLRAQAILARTKAYDQCGTKSNLPHGTHGIWGQGTQEYRYRHVLDFNNPQIYQDAVDFGNDPYLTYNGDTFDVQYRDRGDERNDYRDTIHTDIYDPPGQYYNDTVPGNTTGFLQYNANVWAKGQGPDNALFPPWDYCRLLAHFYTGIHLDCLNTTLPTPDTYRFNVLEFAGMDDMDGAGREPLILRANQLYDSGPMSSRHFPFIVQNTGTNAWYLSCGSDHTAALGLHWYTTSFQPVNFEGSRKALCPSGGGALWLQPGQEFPPQANSNQQLYAYIYVNVPPGEYWLSLDMEFKPPNEQRWGSRLTPPGTYTPQWPTQNIRVRVIDPQPGIDSGHSAGNWHNQREVALSWGAVNDPLLDYYRVCWDRHNGSSGDGCRNENDTTFRRSFSDGIYDFEVTAVTSDNQESDSDPINDLRIDGALPTAQLDPLPLRIQAPDYELKWNSGDTGGSGLQQQQLTYQINNDSIWRTVTAVSNDVDMRSIRFYFPGGQQGDVYEFCLRTKDDANSWSAPSCDSTTYNPDLELHDEPLQLTWYTVYSNTIPNTQTLTIENYGGYILDWAATTPFTLAALGQTTGTAKSIVPVVLTHPVGITATYQGYITVTGTTPGTHNSPQVIPVTIYVRERDNTLYFPIIFKQ